MWLAPLVSHAKAFARARWPASHSRRPVRRKQAPRRARIEQLEGRALLSSYSPFPGVVLGSVDATTSDRGQAAFLDFHGSIVVAGDSYSSSAKGGTRLALFRYDSEGTLDPTFGTQGVVTTALPRATRTYGFAAAPYPSKTTGDPPDRILAGGYVFYSKVTQSFADFALARYNSNGTLDTTFGSNGTVQTDLGGASEKVISILVLEDGRFVAAGQSQSDTGGCFALAGYTSAGQLDTTFGTAGVVKGPAGTMNDAIWDQGKILVVGQKLQESVLARYNLDGSPDTTFNGTGIVSATSGGGCSAAVYPSSDDPNLDAYEGYIVAVGSAAIGNGYVGVSLARYLPDGSPDPTFGSDGKVMTPEFQGVAAGVAIQPDGKIVVGGSAQHCWVESAGQYLSGFMVARYNSDGTVDSTFGSNGITVTPMLNGGPSATGLSLVPQPEGKFVLAGYASDATRSFVALARYLPDGTLDETFGVPAPPLPGITVTPTSGLVTTEAGGTASFSVVLNSQPTADVTISVSSSEPTEGTVSVAMLTFTQADWNTPQIVTVRGVDDTIRDGDKAYTVVLAPAVSSDSGYNNLDPSDVSVTNKDNEKGKITGSALSPGTLTDAALAGLANSDFQRRKSKAKSGPTEAAFSADLPLWEA